LDGDMPFEFNAPSGNGDDDGKGNGQIGNGHGHASCSAIQNGETRVWGHAILLPDGSCRLVDRTNNRQEGFFRSFKHGERRRSGRKILTQDLEQIPATAALALNLRHHDYVQLLCGSLDQLPAAFAKLDASSGVLRDDDELPAETVSRSLPTADRELVRVGDMFLRIAAASDSRAPRR
jgi:hypothetical protein